MADTNMFLFSTVAQVNYFAQIGRLIAERNYNEENILPLTSRGDENNTICVIISNSYGQYADILTSTRRAWQINKANFDKMNIKYIFAIYANVIVGIYKLTKDNSVIKSYEEGRWEFNLQIAELSLQNKWLGIRLDGNSLKGREFHYAYFDTK